MIINPQYQWDVALITKWFTGPGNVMGSISSDFRKKHNLLWNSEEIASLKRYPHSYMQSKMRCQPFICNALPKLGNVLWEADISDVFDIAAKMVDNTLDCQENKTRHYMIDKADNDENLRLKYSMKKVESWRESTGNNWAAHKMKNQWGVTK